MCSENRAVVRRILAKPCQIDTPDEVNYDAYLATMRVRDDLHGIVVGTAFMDRSMNYFGPDMIFLIFSGIDVVVNDTVS
jgi:hypothetical protein